MKKMKFYYNKIGVIFVFTLFMSACSSEDDSTDSKPDRDRTKITMDIPGKSDIDWNNVELVWNEEFNESAELDDIWFFESKNTTNPDIAGQLQVYEEKNVKLSEGTLKLYAIKKAGVYTSARLSGKYAYKYGRIAISAKLPEQEKNGIWAKLALIGDNEESVGWPQCGEIDIMEYFSYIPNTTFITLHTTHNTSNGTLTSAKNNLESVEEEFHEYGILWTEKYIKFYIDDPDNIIHTINRPSSPTDDNWPFDKHFYLLIDMVIGGKHAGAEGVDDSLFPAIMEIDYIRVYQPK